MDISIEHRVNYKQPHPVRGMLYALAGKATLQQYDATAGVVEAGTWLSCQLYLHNTLVSQGIAADSIL